MNFRLNNKLATMNFLLTDMLSSQKYNEIIDVINSIKSKTGKLPTFIFAGVGKNWYICEKVEKTFISMGLKTFALDCTHALHGDMGLLTDQDEHKVMFFISKSGTTDELIRLAKTVKYLKDENKLKNLTTISFYLNPIGAKFDELYDYVFTPTWEEYDEPTYLNEFDARNLVPSMSINTMQMVLDSIGVTLFEEDETLIDNYKYNHLAGNNGKLLGGDKILGNI